MAAHAVPSGNHLKEAKIMPKVNVFADSLRLSTPENDRYRQEVC